MLVGMERSLLVVAVGRLLVVVAGRLLAVAEGRPRSVAGIRLVASGMK